MQPVQCHAQIETINHSHCNVTLSTSQSTFLLALWQGVLPRHNGTSLVSCPWFCLDSCSANHDQHCHSRGVIENGYLCADKKIWNTSLYKKQGCIKSASWKGLFWLWSSPLHIKICALHVSLLEHLAYRFGINQKKIYFYFFYNFGLVYV